MASQQGVHPSKLKACLLPLTGRLCRPKWQVISGSSDAKLCNVHTKKNYLVAILLFVHGAEGDRTTSPSFENINGSIDASSSSLEAQMARCFLQLVCKVGHFTHKKFYLLVNRSFVVAQKAMGKRLPFLQLKTSRLMFPALRWKRPLQLITSGWDANGSNFTTANKYLFADLLLFGSVQINDDLTTTRNR